ncbi:protein trichome birefringence-like 34 isoform X1 [Diospyros lotus]|uniref:protein trichome birefringence-like 34 isoform X1 n=1 Tax=Diospyros lotus TaxID=55363 RepID=UPI00224F3259|nr:protein trichome birefringence-like 34 isoform X1 [Diospyros lotus]
MTMTMSDKQAAHKVSGSWKISYSFHLLVALPVGIFLILAFYSTSRESQLVAEEDHRRRPNKDGAGGGNGCDLFSGKWVLDKEPNFYPLYKEQDCSFIHDGIACEKFGRKDLKYQQWRWQPHDCDLPRFNATAMLERLRNKRLVFVGDSINRNQWVSMVCLVQSPIPPALKSVHLNGSLITFKATEYNATIDFYWAPLLVESNSDDLFHHRIADRIVRAESIEKHARSWTDADILVFNSYLWWRRPKLKVLWGSFGSGDGIYKEVEMLRSYEMALRTWADWLEFHVNRSKTQLFFVTLSPTHNRADEWGKPPNHKCNNETEPIAEEGHQGMDSDPQMMKILESAIGELGSRGLKVQMLNITQLSEYRKDAHPSIHSKKWGPEEISNPVRFADCTHWCLPGVPDVWNLILYAYIFGS